MTHRILRDNFNIIGYQISALTDNLGNYPLRVTMQMVLLQQIEK